MFAPTKTYRKWHRKVNVNQRRYAIVTSLAASACVPLVLARGHKIEKVPEIPLIVSNESINHIAKTKAAVRFLKVLKANRDAEKAKDSKKIRAGKGKARNRRYTLKKGPLIIYLDKSTVCRAFRNLPGVDLCCVTRLNLLYLAPGGHVGRFIIWTQAAYERLETLYGSYTRKSTAKVGYNLPRAVVTNSNLARLLKSPEIVSLLRRKKKNQRHPKHRKNPLQNLLVMLKFNPYAKTTRRRELLSSHPRVKRMVAHKNKQKADRRRLVEASRAKRNFTPKGNVRESWWTLPLLERLKKKGLKPSKHLLAKLQLRKDRKAERRRLRKLVEKEHQAAKTPKASEGAPQGSSSSPSGSAAEKKLYRLRPLPVGRQPVRIIRTPGKPLPVNRYQPISLRHFRKERARRMLSQEKIAGRSLVPNIKPGETPFIEFAKHKRHTLTRKERRQKITRKYLEAQERNKKLKEEGKERPKRVSRFARKQTKPQLKTDKKEAAPKTDKKEKKVRTKRTPPTNPRKSNPHIRAFARLMQS
jgi:ribosomal protein L4